ncbi:MAG: hypothetical protein Q4D42_02755 [Eubacteriales bacterium]|nr:hypothetical protein [Eubacteriales bacterium]
MEVVAEEYFYSEMKAKEEAKQKARKEQESLEKKALESMTKEERKIWRRETQREIIQWMLQYLPKQKPKRTIFDPLKYATFKGLVQQSVDFAKEHSLNVHIYTTEESSGCISFAGETLLCYPEHMLTLHKLMQAADQVHIRAAHDADLGRPIDIDGGIRIEFWFDCFRELPLEK